MRTTHHNTQTNWNLNRAGRFEKLEDRLLLAVDIEFRSLDGTGNNVKHEDWGAANTQLLRLTTVEYGPGDAGAFPSLATRTDSQGHTINPRMVSNLLFDQDVSKLNDRNLTSFIFQWGQFLDHDMDLTEDFAPVGEAELPGENISFLVPTDGTESELPPGTIIPQLRSRFELDHNGIAQQINQITSYIDASNVYGSDDEKAEHLRAGFGGFLLTSDAVNNLRDGTGGFLPFNFEVNGEFLENASPPTTGTGVTLDPDDLFVAGDVRSNEQPGLTAFHTLFLLEHNFQARRIAQQLRLDADDLADAKVDEYVYQLARATVAAEVQSITYNEFLPALFGPDQLDSYRGYQADVNASIANIFSASLYRVGHTMLPSELLLLNEDGTPVPDDLDVLGASVVDGEVDVSEAFFNPALITQFGIEPYLKGLAVQQIQEIDTLIVDSVRNLLFDPPAAVDLGATNLQRGRDHGLADYNQSRIDFGLDPVTSFSEISSDPAVAAALDHAYDGDVNNIDVFAAAIAEDHITGGSVGELLHTVLVDQFLRLRDGDRFYFENVFRGKELAEIQNTRLSDIIRRNTNLQDVQDEVFRTEDVFTYRAKEGLGSMNVTLRVKDGALQITGGSGNRVIASQDLVDTNIVVIYGTSKNDKLRIDDSVGASFAGAVEVHGGAGKDSLILDDHATVFHGNFEKVKLRTVKAAGALASIAASLNFNVARADKRGHKFGNAGRDVPAKSFVAEVALVDDAPADADVGAAKWDDGLAAKDDEIRDLLFEEQGQDRLLGNSLDTAESSCLAKRCPRDASEIEITDRARSLPMLDGPP